MIYESPFRMRYAGTEADAKKQTNPEVWVGFLERKKLWRTLIDESGLHERARTEFKKIFDMPIPPLGVFDECRDFFKATLAHINTVVLKRLLA